MFVSTVYRGAGEALTRLTQGKSILMSHDDKTERRQGIGFWGVKEKCQPLMTEPCEIPDWILRGGRELTEEDIGTKLVIIGFDNAQGWEDNLATSVAENFFGSISEGKLEVSIGEKVELSHKTIQKFFESPLPQSVVSSQKNEPEQYENSRNYLKCLVSQELVINEHTQSQLLGLCNLKILIQEGLPKKIAFLRNGMFISDSLNIPGIKNFSDFKEFVAVFECKDPKGIELLRSMEPPRHDDFEPDRLPTKEDQQKGKRALKEIANWIREMLKRHARDPVSETTTLDELKDFFPDEGDEGNGKPADEINPFGSAVIRAKPVLHKASAPTIQQIQSEGPGPDEEHSSGGGGGQGAGGGDSQGGGQGPRDGETGSTSTKSAINLIDLRAVSTSSKSRRISFTPTQTGEVSISLFEAGADSDYELVVKESNLGEIKKGRLIVEVEKDCRFSVDITFKNKFDGAIKVSAYEV